MVSGHWQAAAFNQHTFGLQCHVEIGDTAFITQIDRAYVGLRVEAIGDDPPVRNLAYKCLYFGMVGAAHCDTVKGNIRDKIQKTLPQCVEIPPVLHMLGIDIGHDRDGGGQPVERTVAFVGLNHHPLALALARV